LCFSASGKLQGLREISAKTVTQLELIEYHGWRVFIAAARASAVNPTMQSRLAVIVIE